MSHLEQQISSLLVSKELCDITIIVGKDDVCFQSHKLLLSLASDVFRAMLYGPMAEEKSEIKLPEDDPNIFSIFLTYIYTSKLAVETAEDAILALYFSDKYVINYMKEDSASYLEKHLSVDCIIEVYEAAVMMQQSQLISRCMKLINRNVYQILNHESFLTAKLETVLIIISKDILPLNSELHIYNAVVKWGEKQENNHLNLRDLIFPLLKEVRFISMTYLEFSESPCQHEILTKDEKLEIFMQKSNPDKEEYNNTEKQWKKERIFQVFSSCYLSSKCCVISENLTFKILPILKEQFRSTQHDLNVWGVSIHINMKLKSTKNANIILYLKVNNLTDKSTKHNFVDVLVKETEDFNDVEVIDVLLKEPVSIMKGESCEITLDFYKSIDILESIIFCKNMIYSYDILNLERITDNKSNSDTRPHFTAILASYCFRKQPEISGMKFSNVFEPEMSKMKFPFPEKQPEISIFRGFVFEQK